LVQLRLEPDEALRAKVQHGTLDHRGLREHEVDRLLLVEPGLVGLRQLAKRRAGPVEEDLPPEFTTPALQPLAVDSFGLVVMEPVSDLLRIEPAFLIVSQFLMPYIVMSMMPLAR
jgi:hypothetical protein